MAIIMVGHVDGSVESVRVLLVNDGQAGSEVDPLGVLVVSSW